MRYYVYILKSTLSENWSYVGYSNDVTRRYAEHSYGKVRSTKGYRPLQLVYVEECSDELSARKREKYLKSGIGREEKVQLIRSGIV